VLCRYQPPSKGGKGKEAPSPALYELRRVRDVHFFDGIPLSPYVFTHHLLGSYTEALQALTKREEGK
jgi:hypothetical protein